MQIMCNIPAYISQSLSNSATYSKMKLILGLMFGEFNFTVNCRLARINTSLPAFGCRIWNNRNGREEKKKFGKKNSQS